MADGHAPSGMVSIARLCTLRSVTLSVASALVSGHSRLGLRVVEEGLGFSACLSHPPWGREIQMVVISLV